ncbi:MAG: 23S rRNA (uracil(1939)-C(5))-methyltransferase RlmD, partial [Bacillota bacterium]|nr:23S rRNA (uracil(1939)-C(5))-methyltransferase RlmD [Bacillota bacterium]
DGFTMFVPYSLPGEVIEAKVTAVKKNYGRGQVLSLIEPAQERRAVSCQCHDQCGGCQLLHLDYEEQLIWKKRLVTETLARIGGIEADVLPVLGMKNPASYRNKVQLHGQASAGKDQETKAKINKAVSNLGYFAARSRKLVSVKACALWPSSFKPVVEKLEQLFVKYQLVEKIKHLVLREGKKGQLMVVAVTGDSNDTSKLQQVAQELLTNSAKAEATYCLNVTSFYHNINPIEGSLILGREFIHLGGTKQLSITIGQLEFLISPAAFFQVNTAQTEVLYNKTAEYAALTGAEVVLDAYCGTGTIGLYLADKAKEVVGIEVVAEAINDARQNAIHNQISNAQFKVGKVEGLLPQMVQQGFYAEVVILDPPRAGCDPQVLAAISQMEPNRIVYVSCDPATLARDLKIMVEEGYEVKEVQPVDMFPQTSHVECVVLIEKK